MLADIFRLYTVSSRDWEGYTLHIYTASGEKEYLRPHVPTAAGGQENKHLYVQSVDCRQEYIHPNVHTVDCGKGYNRYPHCWWWKGINPHPHVYIVDYSKHRLNMEVDLQSLFGLHVTWCAHCTAVLIDRTPATPSLHPPAFGLVLRGRYCSAKIDDISL